MLAPLRWLRSIPLGVRGALAALTILAVIVAVSIGSRDASDALREGSLHVVRRGDLVVSVVENGSVRATKSVKISSEVEGQARIVNVVPEGSFVRKGDLLVELDSAELRDRLIQQDINFQNARSRYAQAVASYDIQVNQSESNVNAAELKVKFARLDLEKYVGTELMTKLDGGASLPELSLADSRGGEAVQRLNKLRADITLADEKRRRAESRLESTKRLAAAEYVPKTEVEADELALTSGNIDLEQAKIALEIFNTYEFPRGLEKLFSDYEEGQRELARVKAKAESENAQADTTRLSTKTSLDLETSKLDKLKDQLAKSQIRAPQDGMVVYSSSTGTRPGSPSSTLIEPGASVRYRQDLIELPDTSEMLVDVDVHEAFIEKVKLDQRATVTVDAFPDRVTQGAVTRIALLPDSPMRWFNPDIKVYRTEVQLADTWPGLKPGMSAQVRIIVSQLHDVLTVPVQSVAWRGGRTACWALENGKVVEKPLEIGLSSDEFAEVKAGLKEGDRVLLVPPGATAEETPGNADKPPAPTEETGRPAETPGEKTPALAVPTTQESSTDREQPQTMTPEEMRKRLEQLPPEERERAVREFRRRRQQRE